MTPDDLDTLIAGAALGDLFEAEAAALERRMAADPSVLAQIEAARRALDQVALAAPAVRPPARLRAELLRQAHASLAPASRRRGGARWLGIWAGAGTAAAAAATVAATLTAGRVADLERTVDRLAAAAATDLATLVDIYRERPQVVTLRAPDGSTGPWAKLMMSGDGDRAMLVVEGLHQPAPGRVYQLWLIRDGTRASSGVFTTDPAGRALMVVHTDQPMLGFQAFGVTEEPAGGSSDPTGARMLAGTTQ